MRLVLPFFLLQGSWQSEAILHCAVCVSLLPDNSEVPRGEAEGSSSPEQAALPPASRAGV